MQVIVNYIFELLSFFSEEAYGLVDINFHPVLECDDERFGEFVEH